MNSVCIVFIILYKFGHCQLPGLIVLFKVNKDLEIYFYCHILSFYLIINLRI